MKHLLRFSAACLVLLAGATQAQTPNRPPAAPTTEKKADEPPFDVREHYTKYEYRIPMRDGVKLFTAVYVPKDQSKPYPFLLIRTPYSVSVADARDGKNAYGEDHFPPSTRHLGPSEDFDRAGYIFVNQDVRGRFESEGKFIEMTPHLDDKKSPADVDPSTDMYDTVDWLVHNVPNNNGRVGIWGISYPGFNTAASIIDSHPAIKAASPEAPMINLFGQGDDAYHGGAFMLAANFSFYSVFRPQHNPTPEPRKWVPFEYGTDDGYQWFLKQGTLGALNKFFKGHSALWDDQVRHDTFDEYWKARDLAPHLKNIHCAVLTVGGWFDGEDLQGPFSAFAAIEKYNPGTENKLVVGPWIHGGWARLDGHRLGNANFDANTADYYRQYLVFPFFEQHLKDAPDPGLAKATVFETGTNVWRHYPSWPPPGVEEKTLYFQPGGGLAWQAPPASFKEFNPGGIVVPCDTYVSDPAKPVPFLAYYATAVPPEYMVSDQRFASTRPDVLTYQTEPLEEDVTIAGPVSPKLFVSTTGTDSDWDVKLIDVYPPDYPDPNSADEHPNSKTVVKDVQPPTFALAGYQQLVRGEPFRGKFRHSMEKPEAFVPDKVEAVEFTMPDIDHTFRRGHRIMVQVQSSWFPLTDRNPQTFVNIPDAKPEDFQAATQKVYRSGAQASGIVLPVLAKP